MSSQVKRHSAERDRGFRGRNTHFFFRPWVIQANGSSDWRFDVVDEHGEDLNDPRRWGSLDCNRACFKREGASHSLWENPSTGHAEAVPRHTEIPDLLAKKICRGLSVPEP